MVHSPVGDVCTVAMDINILISRIKQYLNKMQFKKDVRRDNLSLITGGTSIVSEAAN
jgi:hypothetical protein